MRNLVRIKALAILTTLVGLLLPFTGAAQSPVAITAQVTGSNSAPYTYGTYAVQLVDSNSNAITASNVVISLRVVGGAVTTPPAMNALTSGVSFTVLCGATDTSTATDNYAILN